MRKLFTLLSVLLVAIGASAQEVTYDFTQLDFKDWTTSYTKHEVTYTDAKVTFEGASKQNAGSAIEDRPVTKDGAVIVVLKDTVTKEIRSVDLSCLQWSEKTKNKIITLNYSLDGGKTYKALEKTSADFTYKADALPAGTTALKFTFSHKNNQVGITSLKLNIGAKTAPAAVESVSITDEKGNALGYAVNLTQTETMQLKAAVSPSNAANKNVTWSVLQDSTVISLSESGLVTALKPGLASVVVTTEDGNKQAAVYVNVTEPQPKTIADFLKDKGGVCYLTGTVSNIVNTEYGNFTLTDESGSIYVYGCLTPDGEKKQFGTLDVNEGDVIKVRASEYKLYNKVDEAVDVVFVENYGAPAPPVTFEITAGAEDFTVTPSDTEATYYVEVMEGSLDAIEANLAKMGMSSLDDYADYLCDEMGSGLEYFSGVQTQSYEDDWYMDLEEDLGDYTIVAFAVDENFKRISDVFTKEFTIAGPSEDEIAANQFKQTHATILAKTEDTVDSSDKAAVKAALEDYEDLSVGAKALLAEEKELLDAMYATIGWNEAEDALDELMDKYEDLMDDRVAIILIKSDEELSSELFDEVVPQVEQLEDLMKQGIQTGTPTPDDFMALLDELNDAIDNLQNKAEELYPEGPYAGVAIELMDAMQKYDELDEKYADVRDGLKLTNLWNRVTDQLLAEINRFDWDAENNPEPSDLRLAFHYANINLIRLSYVVFEEAVQQHLTKDEKIQSIFDALLKLVSSRNTMAAQYSAVLDDDAEWKALSARLDIEEAAVNALEGTDPTIEELEAHEAELAAINAAMEAFAAKLESGATSISSAVKAESTVNGAYNLAGQKVSTGYKGIVIKNGKKVMVK